MGLTQELFNAVVVRFEDCTLTLIRDVKRFFILRLLGLLPGEDYQSDQLH